jgi:hypothetical protein
MKNEEFYNVNRVTLFSTRFIFYGDVDGNVFHRTNLPFSHPFGDFCGTFKSIKDRIVKEMLTRNNLNP